MVTEPKPGKSRGEIHRIATEVITVNTIEIVIDLGLVSTLGICRVTRQTKNVIFPSLKKYLPCCKKESSCVSLSSAPTPRKLASLAPRVVRALEASGIIGDFVYGLESKDSIGITGGVFESVTTGESFISSQETIGGAITAE